MPDYQRLQTTLDEIIETVAWAAGYIQYLEENEVHGIGTSDLEILKAELARLRVVADAMLPSRVHDPSSDARWYLAPDEEGPRERRLEELLDEAAAEVERQAKVVAEERREEERRKQEKERADDERYAKQSEERDQVADFLRTHGPATEKEIATATGLSSFAVRHATDGLAKLARDRKYSLTPTTP
jgi:hypothetical protein